MLNVKRLVTVMLVIATVLSLLSGCNNQKVVYESYYDDDDVTAVTVNEGSDDDGTSSEAGTTQKKTVKKSAAKKIEVTDDDVQKTKTATGGRFDNLNYKGKTIKLLLWYTPEPFEQAIYDEFEMLTGAKIKIIKTGTQSVNDKLVALIAANSAPDATVMEQDNFPKFITKNLIQPIDSYISRSEDKWLAFDIMDDIKYGDKYYGVTDHFWGDTFFVYYNKDLFDNELSVKENPKDLYNSGKWNWDTFYDLAKQMTKKDSGNNIIQYGAIHTQLNLFALSAGATVVKANNGNFTNTLNSKEMKDAAEMEKKLSKDGYYVVDQGDFAKGNVAMCVHPQYPLRNKGSWDSYNFNWDAVPFPSYTNGQSYNPAGYQFGVVPMKAKEPEAGFMLMNFRAYCQENMTTLKNSTPERLELYKKVALGQKKAPLDVGVVGTQMWTLYRELANSGKKTQTPIDEWLPKIDGKLVEFYDEVKAYSK